MRKRLVVAMALSLSCWGGAFAQPVPAYQTADSAAASGSSGGNATSQLYFMIQQLQQEVSRLEGKLEEQQHRIDQLQSQAKDRYIDLDQRILDLNKKLAALSTSAAQNAPSSASGVAETGSAQAGAGVAGASSGAGGANGKYAPPTAQESADYEAIRKLIKDKQYDSAIDRLYQFISKYPQGDLTVNAYYWLGEVYLAKPQLEQAKQAFTIVTTQYPDHRKAPDALYKLAVVNNRMGNTAEARKLLGQVQSQYPSTHAADLAQAYLDGLAGSGSSSAKK
ncbi:tol-pal system protein YbgF [Mangrovitalea sediminis]|uniref:tol-pal system protein YbgF n=1 Tax=Mangrovitalea sediminis TaxID=1982043 RepID=UPI000BE53476|nr:tol-pal system protein YbgF [Mangrovitalea sediminis]